MSARPLMWVPWSRDPTWYVTPPYSEVISRREADAFLLRWLEKHPTKPPARPARIPKRPKRPKVTP